MHISSYNEAPFEKYKFIHVELILQHLWRGQQLLKDAKI